MSSEPQRDPSPSAPEPEQPDGDAREPTAQVQAQVFADDHVVEKPNAVLDALVARDRELAALAGLKESELPAAAAAPAAAAEPAGPPATKTQEWSAAIVLMLLFAGICFALVSLFRG